MQKFVSVTGDTYIGYVKVSANTTYQGKPALHIVMDNYSVWYEGTSQPYESTNADDSVSFITAQDKRDDCVRCQNSASDVSHEVCVILYGQDYDTDLMLEDTDYEYDS